MLFVLDILLVFTDASFYPIQIVHENFLLNDDIDGWIKVLCLEVIRWCASSAFLTKCILAPVQPVIGHPPLPAFLFNFKPYWTYHSYSETAFETFSLFPEHYLNTKTHKHQFIILMTVVCGLWLWFYWYKLYVYVKCMTITYSCIASV